MTCLKWPLLDDKQHEISFPEYEAYRHNSYNSWISDCCGMRLDNVEAPIVAPTDSYLGCRVYVGGHINDAGPQNNVVNLTTRNGPVSLVLTKVVLTSRNCITCDPGCVDENDNDQWDDFNEEDE